MRTRLGALLSVIFYGGLLLVLLGVLFQLWAEVLPGGIAAQIGRNSEGYLAALVIGAWIQYARPRLVGTSREWLVVGIFVAVAAAAGVILLTSDWASRVRTLNETCFALALIIPYLQLRRRPSRAVAVGLALAVLVVVLISQQSELGTDLAETLGLLMLTPIAFDAVDRSILQPSEVTAAPIRYGWYAAMVALPVIMTVLEYQVEVGGLFGEVTRYGVRIHEAFIAMLLLEVYFTVFLGRTGSRSAASVPGASSHAR